jgi:hypothetical protein
VQTLYAWKRLSEYSLPLGVPPDLDNNSAAGLPVCPPDFLAALGAELPRVFAPFAKWAGGVLALFRRVVCF